MDRIRLEMEILERIQQLRCLEKHTKRDARRPAVIQSGARYYNHLQSGLYIWLVHVQDI